MRPIIQLVLALALLVALVAANPLAEPEAKKPLTTSRRKTMHVKQVMTKHKAQNHGGYLAYRKALRKFGHGDAVPELKKATQNNKKKTTANKAEGAKSNKDAGDSSETATTDQQDTQYVCEVQVATAKFRLNFDTGSSDL